MGVVSKKIITFTLVYSYVDYLNGIVSMFIGDYSGKIDAKGRVIIPAQFRRNCEGGERFVLKRNVYDKALDLYLYRAWVEELERFQSRLNPYNRMHNTLLREYCRGTAEVALDASGRILLPKKLLAYAEVEREVVIAGLGDKMVVWSEAVYEKMALSQDEFEENFAKTLGDE